MKNEKAKAPHDRESGGSWKGEKTFRPKPPKQPPKGPPPKPPTTPRKKGD